jgi:hypothetical protein
MQAHEGGGRRAGRHVKAEEDGQAGKGKAEVDE